MNIKVIKTEKEYDQALAMADRLMDAAPGSPEADDLELLSLLIEKYEEEHYPIQMPDPISAIKFRMDQEGLTQKDLIPYIGSQPKVSAVLNGKRELSKDMIRKLHLGLGIPYEVLLKSPGASLSDRNYSPDDYPFKEMVSNGYFPGINNLRAAKLQAEDLLENFFSVLQNRNAVSIYLKSANKAIHENSLKAWQAQALHLVKEKKLPPFAKENLDRKFLEILLNFSAYESGLPLVQEHLEKAGIHFIILKHLPHTYLDGACFTANDGNPLVGLTLRNDRLDNFWFTLFHELAHVKLHLLNNRDLAFFDETEGNGNETGNQYEVEANTFARKMMIPDDYWERNIKPILHTANSDLVVHYAKLLKLNPAILAGRIRYERNDYSKFPELVGYKKVSKQLEESKI